MSLQESLQLLYVLEASPWEAKSVYDMNSTEKKDKKEKKESPWDVESAHEMNSTDNRETILFPTSNIKAPSFTQLHQKR